MKKFMTFLLALSITSYAATAGLPLISFGVKAGLATEKQHMKRSMLTNIGELNKATIGYHAGIVMRLDLPVLPIYFQPELLYNWSKINSAIIEGTDVKSNIRLFNFNVPVLVGVGFGSARMIKLRANLGPVFNLASGSRINGQSSDSDLSLALRKNSVTWTAGVGIDLLGIMFDVRYNGNFKRTKTNTVTASPQSWTFSLGYLF